MERIITEALIQDFYHYLVEEEKSGATIEKYLRDIRRFWKENGAQPVTKDMMMRYKQTLVEKGYAARSINSMLASLNSLLNFCGWLDCRVKNLKTQRRIYCPEEKELTRKEYERLLQASQRKPRLNLLLQAICSTGIRVSELRFFTVEAVKRGEVNVQCKSKSRTVILPEKLRKKLLCYAAERHIKSGSIFISRNGKPLNRSNIWAQMKQLCETAQVAPTKVYPHNLRKLFARMYYTLEKDIAKLADLLGHANINTTRIYIMSTGFEHRRQIERLGLVT